MVDVFSGYNAEGERKGASQAMNQFTLSIIIPAYGPNTGIENWYKNQYGKKVVLAELRKTIQMDSDTL